MMKNLQRKLFPMKLRRIVRTLVGKDFLPSSIGLTQKSELGQSMVAGMLLSIIFLPIQLFTRWV
ncbi:MAG: hypothetical protein HC780_05245 [Leptolyngbyaceae cyanobacterium CSU_1_3]|nr:hypothetical protein [Leptolyngbyaceae cyanobacterium CSU_1_3]